MCCGSFFSFEDVVLLRLPRAEAHATPYADTSRLHPSWLVTCFRWSMSDSRFGRGVPSSGRMDWTCCSGVSRASLRNVAAEVKPPVDSSHRVWHCLVHMFGQTVLTARPATNRHRSYVVVTSSLGSVEFQDWADSVFRLNGGGLLFRNTLSCSAPCGCGCQPTVGI